MSFRCGDGGRCAGPGLRGPAAIGLAAIKRLVIDELEVRRLRVVELEVVSERRPSTSAGEGPEPAAGAYG
jgi:hypothetical protein